MSTPPPPALAPTCSMRERIEQVLAEADRVETAWIEVQGALGDPTPKEWQEHDDARSALAQAAVEVLRDLLAAVDGRREVVLGQQTPALELSADGRRLDAVNLAPTHGPIGTRCPHCGSRDAGIYEVDRAERYNETSIQPGPARRSRYGILQGQGLTRLGDEPNPNAGLPLLRVNYTSDRGHFEHHRYICRACSNPVSLDTWVQVEGL